MAIELARSITIAPRRDIQSYVFASKPNLKLIDTGKIISQKIAFEASMQRAQLSQQYWNDILEKLRKLGGGGGGSKFDRITVSMQLMNFLSNKTIQAMLSNLKLDVFNLKNNSSGQINNANQNVITTIVQSIGKSIINVLIVVCRGVSRHAPTGIIKSVPNNLLAILGILSFQLNKLKEILQEDLKELIKRLDIKGKIKNIKIKIFNTVVMIEDKLIEILELFGVLSKKLFTFN